MNKWNKKANEKLINEVVSSLQKNNITAVVVDTKDQARQKFLDLVPEGSEVMTNTSVTLEESGIAWEVLESGKYDSVKNKLMSMNNSTQKKKMKEIGSVSEYSIGSVHAITKEGKIMIASRSGSQIPGYAYGADHVIWFVGSQKLVNDLDEGFKRIYEYDLPLESERARKAYGSNGSEVAKILIFNIEPIPNRTTVVIIKEPIGY